MVMIRASSFQSILAPNDSETNRKGTMADSFLFVTTTGSCSEIPLTDAIDAPIQSSILIPSLIAVIIFVCESYCTSAPNASKTARIGTIVVPCSIYGASLKYNGCPFSII